jgi:hypothetical protein
MGTITETNPLPGLVAAAGLSGRNWVVAEGIVIKLNRAFRYGLVMNAA